MTDFEKLFAHWEKMRLHLEELDKGQHSYDGTETRKNGGVCHHAVLDNNPLVDGYLSPMWDGGMLRYETQEVYDMLSM